MNRLEARGLVEVLRTSVRLLNQIYPAKLGNSDGCGQCFAQGSCHGEPHKDGCEARQNIQDLEDAVEVILKNPIR